jgi:hypothetical protein
VSDPDSGTSLARVCLHEYAHLAAARAFGACGFVRIRRIAVPAGEPAQYSGSFQMHGELGEWQWRVVALAGTLAEWMHDGAGLAVADVVARLAAGSALSPQDARLGDGYDDDDVRCCLELLDAQWDWLCREASQRAAEIETQSTKPR